MIKYSENGLWIKQEDNRYTVGISPKGQDDIGDVSFVDLLDKDLPIVCEKKEGCGN